MKTITRHRTSAGVPVLAAALALTLLQAAPSRAVVGGTPAPAGAYPFIVSLRDNGFPYCGGTLIAPQWVLTAAHCLTGRSPAELTAVVDQSTVDSGTGRLRGAAQLIADPQYDPATENYDAGLIRLDAPVDGIDPAVLIQPGDTGLDAPGIQATVIGYGSTTAQNINGIGAVTYPGALEQAPVSLVTPQRCASVFNGRNEPSVSNSLMLCAGGDGRHDACVGDSGGPMLVPGLLPGTWTDVAITSWGAGCAVLGVPGVYTRLSNPQIAAFITDHAVS